MATLEGWSTWRGGQPGGVVTLRGSTINRNSKPIYFGVQKYAKHFAVHMMPLRTPR